MGNCPCTTRILLATTLLLMPLYALAQQAPEPRRVTTRPFSELLVYPEHSAPATTISVNDSKLSAQLNALIASIDFQVGDTVKVGDTVATLDCQDYELQKENADVMLKRSRSLVNLRRQQLKRARALADENNLSKELLNQRQSESQTASADLAAARIALEQAAVQISRCAIKAPFNGVVMERLAGTGELANVGTPVLRLLDTSQLELSAQVPVDRVDQLIASTNIEFRHRNQSYPLAIRAITPAINTQARNREARLIFVSESALPGSAGRMSWRSPDPHLPSGLLLRRNGELGVFVVIDGRAHFHVITDALEGQPVAASLPLSSAIVTEGAQSLRDGDPVQQ